MHRRETGVANDVAQEAFVRALLHWPRVGSYDRPDLWVQRVAVRLAIKAAKQAQRRGRAVEDTDLVMHAAPQDLDLIRQISTLPAAQRAAIVLHYLEDRPVAEVADMMQCSVPTAKVHLHRGRKRLAILLDSETAR